MLFMKGTAHSRCAVSPAVPSRSQRPPAEPPGHQDLQRPEDEAVRQGIKDYANWPTIPSSTSTGELSAALTSRWRCTESGELQQALTAP